MVMQSSRVPRHWSPAARTLNLVRTALSTQLDQATVSPCTWTSRVGTGVCTSGILASTSSTCTWTCSLQRHIFPHLRNTSRNYSLSPLPCPSCNSRNYSRRMSPTRRYSCLSHKHLHHSPRCAHLIQTSQRTRFHRSLNTPQHE